LIRILVRGCADLRTGAITLSIESEFRNVFLIGLAINKIACSIPLSQQAAFEMELAVVEAVNNAVEHAHRHRRDKRVTVQIKIEVDFIRLTVIDEGAPIQPETFISAEAGMENASEIERGRGLAIIRALMDEVRCERRGKANHITLTKYVKRS
jgi:serine/threonine-protein kinase RsbW